jgi:hypothetical protein
MTLEELQNYVLNKGRKEDMSDAKASEMFKDLNTLRKQYQDGSSSRQAEKSAEKG